MFIKAYNFSQQEVGRNIKSTKKKYTWKFSIDNIDQELILYVSSLSGRKQITLNGHTVHEESNLFGDFRYINFIERCPIAITPQNDIYELYLDNLPFIDYFKSKSNRKNDIETKQQRGLYEEDNRGYDFSPLKDPEPSFKQREKSNTTLKLKVQANPIQNNGSKSERQPKIQNDWWTKNESFNNFGTPSTNGTENMFQNFGFSFETPPKNTYQQQQFTNWNTQTMNQRQKINPFLNQNNNDGQVFQNEQQPSSQYGLTQSWQSNIVQQAQTSQQINKQVTQPKNHQQQIMHQEINQNIYQNKIPNFQQQNSQSLIQQQQQIPFQAQKTQSLSMITSISNLNSPPKQQQQASIDLLDLNDSFPNENKQQSQIFTNQQQNQQQHNYYIHTPQTQIYQNYTQSQQNYFNNQQNPQSLYQPQYRTTQSMQPTITYQTQKINYIDELFNDPPPQRSTPFDDLLA